MVYTKKYKVRIRIYKNHLEKSSFTDWFNALDGSIQDIVDKRLERVRYGNFGDCTRIKDGKGIWELIINVGPGYRIYFGKINDEEIILLIGGIKKSQTKDIEVAKRYWQGD